MACIRTISPDFWTCESIVDCTPMARLLFIGLWTFADDFGVQPLRPRTIRLQVFPGDETDGDAVHAMIEELAAQGLVRVYNVKGQDYVAIVGWDQLQRVSKRARRRYPHYKSCMPGIDDTGEQRSPTIPNHDNFETARDAPAAEAGEQPSRTIADHDNAEMPGRPASGPRRPPEPEAETEPQRWRAQIKCLLRSQWHRHSEIDSVDDETAERWTSKWIAEGLDYRRDIVPAVRDFYIMQPHCPPADWRDLDARLRRPAAPA